MTNPHPTRTEYERVVHANRRPTEAELIEADMRNNEMKTCPKAALRLLHRQVEAQINRDNLIGAA